MTAKIPEGFATITPSINVVGAEKAIELYTKAFGAQVLHKMMCQESGKVMHAALNIGSSKLFIADANPEMGCGASNSNFYLYMPDVDAAFAQAKQAGLSEMMPVTDMFWGDRTGTLKDAFGNSWTIATHVKDVSPEEMKEGQTKFMEMMKNKKAA